MKIFTVPVRVFVDVTVAVKMNEPLAGTLALDVVSVMEVGIGPRPPPPPPLPPPPQPSTKVNTNKAPAKSAAPYLFLLRGGRRRDSITNPLTKLADHQVHLSLGAIQLLTCITAAEATGPPIGPVVVRVIVTGTGAPFKFTVDELRLRLMPEGSEDGLGPSVTGLGVLERGVTFTVTVWDCPAVTVILASCRLKSGIMTLMPIELEANSKFVSPEYPACTPTNCA